MKLRLIFPLIIAVVSISQISAVRITTDHNDGSKKAACCNEITVLKNSDAQHLSYLRVPCLYEEGWDTLNQVAFWRKIISLGDDSSLANVFTTRQVLRAFPRTVIDSLERIGKLDSLRKELRAEYGIEPHERVLFTRGKGWFYNYSSVSLKIARAIHIFDSLGVDPFYAQSVLLIESPGSHKAKSSSGAYGNFQLMPFVAKKYGLRVDKYVDERENFDRSAYAAAMLFKEICVPYAVRWCRELGFDYNEKELWFKLLVLHNYNAGAGTVKGALMAVNKEKQGMELIQSLWHTTAGRFRSESQNYSQIALACYLKFESYVAPSTFVSSTAYDRF